MSAPQFKIVSSDGTTSDARQPDVQQSAVQGRGGYILSDGPANLSWLRGEIGVGRMPGAFLRESGVVFVASVTEEGYIPPRHKGDDNGPATIAPMTPMGLSTRVTDLFGVRKMTDKGTKPTFFPIDVCARLLETADQCPHIRPLAGVVHTPVARADAGILHAPGYDDASGYLHMPGVEVGIVPDRPTDAQVEAATTYLRGLVSQFAWGDEHSEAGFWAMMLTPLLRLVLPGPYKIFGITAHERGSGKTLLAELAKIVHGGSLQGFPADDAELEKAISSILHCTTGAVAILDNIRGTLQSARLEALATSGVYSGRILGSTNNTPMKNDRVWVVTGNNLSIGGDLDRRMTWISLDPGVEKPELRTGFDIPNLKEYVTEHRGEVLRALLTWIAAWDAKGREVGEATSDTFGPWIATVRSILEIAGVPGTFDHQDAARAAATNPAEAEWGEFLVALREEFGGRPWQVREVTDLMSALDVTARARGEALLEALPSQLFDLASRPAGPKGIRKSLAQWLANRTGRWRDGLAIEAAGKDRKGVALWKVAKNDA